jgi:glutamate-ammonia-ligase adenylyltransferase
MLVPEFDSLPGALEENARTAWANILERASDTFIEEFEGAALPASLPQDLARVLACSPFAAETLRSHPRLLSELLVCGALYEPLEEGALAAELSKLLETHEELHVTLRRFRQRHMLRILWRDFCRIADTRETVRDTSLLAEASISIALGHVHAELTQRFGQPMGYDSGEPQQLIVLAMGKLGARELNLSSDVDLIFAFPEAGQTEGGEKRLSNEEFFTRVGRGLISALDQVTADGFVFRVDMRLRPYGESGALVHNFAALEAYYQDQGRDWERYALIKARPITGVPASAAELMESLRPFIYRRYIDYGVIDSLRSMKQMITAEVRRRKLENNVKLGHGGIREVEFIAQCFQLIRGGRDIGLQQRELLPVLQESAALGCLPQGAVDELTSAYLFLRDAEHAIQGYQDRQTQELPTDQRQRQSMAFVLGFACWDEFVQALDAHRTIVAGHFRELIAPPEEHSLENDGQGLWGEGLTEEVLRELGYGRPTETLSNLNQMSEQGRVVTLQVEGRERLEQFMPMLLRACAEAKDPDLALERVLPLVLAVLRRSAYLVLLTENPPALAELVVLCGASPWISQQLASHPALLDEFLDRSSLYTAPDKDLLREELQQQVARLAEDDLEAQMEALRYFKSSQVLRVAASELVGRLPLMKVSDKLTWIAEVILEHVLAVAWHDLVQKYGEPSGAESDTGFAVFAYGKMGGLELGYGSDLDLVFVHGADRSGFTNGERSIDNAVFYTRLGQRMIHILETRMSMGPLYEVDMRLRPSGESGMLVTTLQGFRSYQQDSAWTWEHQALVRARFVAGDPAVAREVESVRRDILCQTRDLESLGRDVVDMREKMRKHLLSEESPEEGEFHLKQGEGGIVDIEFMVQYAVLAWSHREPELGRWSDNIRILETLGREGFFEQSECNALTQAYIDFRSAAHQLSLQQQPGTVPAGEFVDAQEAVKAKWRDLFPPEKFKN